jgi:hypothetical protein
MGELVSVIIWLAYLRPLAGILNRTGIKFLRHGERLLIPF